MSRGLPWSVLLHALLLVLTLMYGNTVQRRVTEPPLLIRARLVPSEAFADQAETQTPAPEADPETTAPPEPAPELPPKEVPKERPQPEPEQEPKTKPKPPQAKPETRTAPTTGPAAQAGQAGTGQQSITGPSMQGTDANFPFAWYVGAMEGQIARNWHPRQLGFGERSRVTCVVHFVVGRGGAISQITVVQGSGVGVYDREALRAVQATRLPPLPPQYSGSSLGVTFIFNLEPGM